MIVTKIEISYYLNLRPSLSQTENENGFIFVNRFRFGIGPVFLHTNENKYRNIFA